MTRRVVVEIVDDATGNVIGSVFEQGAQVDAAAIQTRLAVKAGHSTRIAANEQVAPAAPVPTIGDVALLYAKLAAEDQAAPDVAAIAAKLELIAAAL